MWILKLAILQFLRRLTGLTWSRSHQTTLVAIRWTLALTFIATVVSDLAECRPFHRYWQVLPDPGGQCRQGYAQLITMATCNIITDALLILFPIPIIVRSRLATTRKIQLILLFSLSLAVVAVTIYRIPRTIEEHGLQQFRSLMASVELLFATAAANALVLGSFVRDRGVKKQKFRRNSGADSFDRSSNPRRPTIHRQWGSDEDLVRDVGLGIDSELRGPQFRPVSRLILAPIVPPDASNDSAIWQDPKENLGHAEQSDDSLLHRESISRFDQAFRNRRLSFLDVGGLLENSGGSSGGSYRRESYTSSSIEPSSPHTIPPASVPATTGGARRGSTALLQDLGGLLGPLNTRSARAKPRSGTELQPIPQSRSEQVGGSQSFDGLELMDPGGLLK